VAGAEVVGESGSSAECQKRFGRGQESAGYLGDLFEVKKALPPDLFLDIPDGKGIMECGV